MTGDVGIHDHLATEGRGPEPAGVYRVVGTATDAVTLLRVADADGRRRSTGEVYRVGRSEIAGRFRVAEDPDPRFDPLNALDGLRWLPAAVFDRMR